MPISADNPDSIRSNFDPLLSSELRFFIMTILAMYKSADFAFLKKQLSATDGNLSASLTKLEEASYLKSHKEFVGKRPHSTYHITDLGLEKLTVHLETMKAIHQEITGEKKQ